MDDDADRYGALAIMRSMGVVVVFDEHEIADEIKRRLLEHD